MKKIIVSCLIITIMLASVPTAIFASDDTQTSAVFDITDYSNSELDLSQYTIDDVLSMNSEEFTELLNDFERVYDPFDSYVEPEITNSNSENMRWTSGDDFEEVELENIETHEKITLTACNILLNDKGFFANNESDILVITLLISLASILPDKDEDDLVFAGHFYDPTTQDNYLSSKSYTARTNAAARFDEAVSYANNNNMEKAYEYLGRCLHYVQDANEPHHAANLIHNPLDNPVHGQFEDYVNANFDLYMGELNTMASVNYTHFAVNYTISSLVHRAAQEAKSKIGLVIDMTTYGNWASVASECLPKAAKYSATVMYKFALAQNVPFYNF